MSIEIIIVLTIVLASTCLFLFNLVSPEVVALLVMVLLVLSGILTPLEAYSGFGSTTWMMIFSLLVMTEGLVQSGIVGYLSGFITTKVGHNPKFLLICIVVLTAIFSAFISNTATTALFLPVILGISEKLKKHPGNFLLPLAFASILTSSVTLISSSTNLVVSELLVRQGYQHISMFELAPVGIVISIAGLIYLLTFGVKIINIREDNLDNSINTFERSYLTEIIVLEGSFIDGKRISELNFATKYGLTILRILRGSKGKIFPTADTTLKAHDLLLVEGSRDDLMKIKDQKGLELKEDFKMMTKEMQIEDLTLVEALIPHGSRLVGKTLSSMGFRDRYQTNVLALNRVQESQKSKIGHVYLREGDILLLQGESDNIRLLHETNLVTVLSKIETSRINKQKAFLGLAIFILCLVLATSGLLDLSLAVLIGMVLTFAFRCVSPGDIFQRIDWTVLILIGGMLALSVAMEKTGTGKYLANELISLFGKDHHAWIYLSIIFILTVFFTQVMSNQAAAIVMIPIAIQTAIQLEYSPRSFAMMVALASSCSYLTPLEPSCLMVYGPGNYRPIDFLKVGLPLTILIYLIAIILVPIVWPLN